MICYLISCDSCVGFDSGKSYGLVVINDEFEMVSDMLYYNWNDCFCFSESPGLFYCRRIHPLTLVLYSCGDVEHIGELSG